MRLLEKAIVTIEVEVPTPLGATAYFYALVDTGADDLVIPDAYLSDFFVGGVATSTTSIKTAGGTVSMPIFFAHDFYVDGVKVTGDVVFASSLGQASALCGRVPLIKCSAKFGLRRTELLRE